MTLLLLRADAGPGIGVGHLARCVALAEEALTRGWRVMLSGETAGWLTDHLDLTVLPPATDLAALAVEVGADTVLVDHYGLGELPAVRAVATLASLEDGRFGRRVADVVIDANLAPGERPDDGSGVVLRGPRYAPLRAEVRVARNARGLVGGTPPRVVVVMGGGAVGAAVGAALAALRDTGLPMTVLAITATEVPVPAAAPGQHFAVQGPVTGLPALFAEADLVVSAAGVTLLELCCVGVPTALVQVADNQATGYAAAVRAGLVVGLGTPADLDGAADVLRDLLLDPDRRNALGAAARAAVDGRGAGRIVDVLEPAPVVRAATEADAHLLLAWRNDEQTRAWSRGDAVEPAEHRAWLARVLADPDRRLLVAEQENRPVGTVRFDRATGTEWEVSVTVAPSHRGRGLAALILAAGEATLGGGVTVFANVHRDNAASLALFRRAGYRKCPDRPADGPFGWLEKVLDSVPSRE